MMRGGWLHNRMVAGLADVLRRGGAWVRLEHAIRVGGRTLAGDLYAGLGHQTILVEVERRPDRVPTDLTKAEALGAVWCVIVTPTPRIARTVTRKLTARPELRRGLQCRIVVWPYGVAQQRVAELLSLDDSPHISADIKTSNQSETKMRGGRHGSQIEP